jgi:hypothetical protein
VDLLGGLPNQIANFKCSIAVGSEKKANILQNKPLELQFLPFFEEILIISHFLDFLVNFSHKLKNTFG